MTRQEFLNYKPPRAKPGYRLLYHGTGFADVDKIRRGGLLTKYSKSPPRGTIWATTGRDVSGLHGGAIVTFQVPKDDPAIEYVTTGGAQAIIARDISPKDILEIDPYLQTQVGSMYLSEFRSGRYADVYWDHFSEEGSSILAELREDVHPQSNALAQGEKVTGGVLKIPPGMFEAIWEEALVVIAQLTKKVTIERQKDIRERLDAIRDRAFNIGKSEGPLIGKRISKGMWAKVFRALDAVLDDLDRDLDEQSPEARRLLVFINGFYGNLTPGRFTKGLNDLSPDKIQGHVYTLRNSYKTERESLDFHGWRTDRRGPLRALMGGLHVLAHVGTRRSKKAEGLAKDIGHLILQKKASERRYLGEQELRKEDAAKVARLKKQKKTLDDIVAFCNSITKDHWRHTWGRYNTAPFIKKKIPVDLTGVPDNYPTDIIGKSKKWESISLLVYDRTAKNADHGIKGSWHPGANSMTIMVGNIHSRTELKKELREIRTTIRHELQHMMQSLITDSIAWRKKQRPATEDDPEYGVPFEVKESQKEARALEKKYPDVSKHERYYLKPSEFFPWIESSGNDFIELLERNPGISPREAWSVFTGGKARARGASIYVHDFYKVLKRYRPKEWKRAVAEGWLRYQNRPDARPLQAAVSAELREDVHPQSKLAQHAQMVLKRFGEQHDYPGTEWLGVERLCYELAKVTQGVAVEVPTDDQPWYDYASTEREQDGKDWRYVFPDPEGGAVVVNCHSLLHDDVWTLSTTVFSTDEIDLTKLKLAGNLDHWTRAMLWQMQTVKVLAVQGYDYDDALEEMVKRHKLSANLGELVAGLLPGIVKAFQNVMGKDPTPRDLSLGVSEAVLLKNKIGEHEGPKDQLPYSIITVHPTAFADPAYLEQVMKHELIHYVLHEECTRYAHGQEFQDIAGEVKLDIEYRD